MEFMKKSINKRASIADLREDRGWSKAELGRRANLAPQTVAAAERGDKVSRLTYVKIAKAFGLTIDDIDC